MYQRTQRPVVVHHHWHGRTKPPRGDDRWVKDLLIWINLFILGILMGRYFL